MKYFYVIVCLIICKVSFTQELFVYTEPASNMAAKGVGIRLNNYLMENNQTNKLNYHLLPELMIGINKKLMIHAEAFLSNRNNQFVAEGGSLYAKYRFLSNDELHSHLRMAAYGRYSFNNSDIHQPAIDFFGHSSGAEIGVIATKLMHKVAISSSASLLHASDNGKEKFNYPSNNRNAIGYTLSVGKLLLPKDYVSYTQTNLNVMVELLGQYNLGSNNSFIDIAPSAQLIFNSTMRLDVAYRWPIVNSLYRSATQGFLVRFEYNFFNAFK
jgi:hypothetical protein